MASNNTAYHRSRDLEGERDGDRGCHIGRHAIYEEWFVPPLPDGVNGGLSQQGVSRPHLDIADRAIAVDEDVQKDRTLNARLSGQRWIRWVDSGNQIGFRHAGFQLCPSSRRR